MDRIDGFKIAALFELPACPKCGSENIRISSTSSRVPVKSNLFTKPFRCRNCHYRFFVFMPSRAFLAIVAFLGILFLALFFVIYIRYWTPIALEARNVEITNSKVTDPDLSMALRYKDNNDAEALRLFEVSAKKGNSLAEYYYGLALLEGNGVVQNFKEAKHWLETAANLGEVKAQKVLGDIYYDGIGVSKDDGRAYFWYMLAAAKKDPVAIEMRDRIANKLSMEQVVLIQDEAKEFSANHTN